MSKLSTALLSRIPIYSHRELLLQFFLPELSRESLYAYSKLSTTVGLLNLELAEFISRVFAADIGRTSQNRDE